MNKRRSAKNRKTTTGRRAKRKYTRRVAVRGANVKDQMLSILLRGRKQTLGEACKAAGVSVQTYYHRLRNASFSERKGKAKKHALSSLDAKKLMRLVQRQARLQNALAQLTRQVF